MCLTYTHQNLFNEQTFDASSDFRDIFNLLLKTREFIGKDSHTESRTEDLSAQLQNRFKACRHQLLNLSRHDHYSRHVIGVQQDWVGYICRWEKNVTSCVHGHPWFAYYQVIDGLFDMDLYERLSNEWCTPENGLDPVKHVATKRMHPGDVVWSRGKPGRYDNLIHRVGTGAKPGFTLHLFSENPGLGEHYRIAS